MSNVLCPPDIFSALDLSNPPQSSGEQDNKQGAGVNHLKSSFLSDLASKMAAGPPKKPVGLLKKSNVAERAEEEAKKQNKTSDTTNNTNNQAAIAQAAIAQSKLADILNQPVEQPTSEKRNWK